MTRTSASDPAAARLALVGRQRRFEWALARDEHVRAAARFVAGHTHDLLNLVQIVRLASAELERRCGEAAHELVEDLLRAVTDAQRSLTELMAVARPEEPPPGPGAPVAAIAGAAAAALRGAIDLELSLALAPGAEARCSAEELEHALLGLALDASEESAGPVQLLVRSRDIAGAPWIELVCGTARPPAGDRFELRVVEAVAARAGGELARSPRRGGGEEVILALPAAAPASAPAPPAPA